MMPDAGPWTEASATRAAMRPNSHGPKTEEDTMGKPKRTAVELAEQYKRDPKGMTKHEQQVARRYIARKEQQLDWAKRDAEARARAAEMAKLQAEAGDKQKIADEALGRLLAAFK